MHRNILLIPGIIAAAVLVGIAAYTYFNYQAPLGGSSDTVKNPALAGKLLESGAGRITIEFPNGSKKSFTVSSDTRVVSVVKSGEAGKALADILPGTQVFVLPVSPGSSAVAQISMGATPLPDDDPRGPSTSITGTIVSLGNGILTVRISAADVREITLEDATAVLSGVLAGQQGKSLSDAAAEGGLYVQVEAVPVAGGLVARSVQILSLVQ